MPLVAVSGRPKPPVPVYVIRHMLLTESTSAPLRDTPGSPSLTSPTAMPRLYTLVSRPKHPARRFKALIDCPFESKADRTLPKWRGGVELFTHCGNVSLRRPASACRLIPHWMGISREGLELQASALINRPSLNCKWNFYRQITNHSKSSVVRNSKEWRIVLSWGRISRFWLGEWPIETLGNQGKGCWRGSNDASWWAVICLFGCLLRDNFEVYILVFSMNTCISQSSSFRLLIARSVVQATARHQCHLRGHSSEYSYLHTSVCFYIPTLLNLIYLTVETKTCIKSRIFMVSMNSSRIILITLTRQDEPRESYHTPY